MDYDKIASSYNRLYKEEQLKKLKAIEKILNVRKEDYLLDIGSGTGISTNYFKCNCFGLDPSFKMLKFSKDLKVCGYAENLPFKENTFDIIIAVTSFHNFIDFRKAILEIKRVSKKNAKIVITVMKKSSYLEQITDLIKENFIFETIEEEKDIIFYGNLM
ncbi:class I SAM-dependent methyltransferase [Candidatus Woesearchaeota archaeon]|nr:class I SAM-dependent methyltransferase [Candidatus Woesearchaeota archaeon]